MASTRNSNSAIDYKQQCNRNAHLVSYLSSPHYGTPGAIHLSGNGLNHSRLPLDALSSNALDTESFLFGIGSTNLVTPAPAFVAQPNVDRLVPTHLFVNRPVIMPDPMAVATNQRPNFRS